MKDVVGYEDFVKLDIRVGEIVEAEAPEWSEKLLQFMVDFGEEIGKRTILSGIKQWYQPEEFVGKKGVFVVNLAPKKMGPSESEGMWIMSDTEDKPIPIMVDGSIGVGTVVR